MGVVLAMGIFDGVHLGHQKLLRSAVDLAEKLDAQPIVYTFSNHPQGIVSLAPPQLMTNDERREAIEALGLGVHFDVFTSTLGAMQPEAFLEYLSEKFDIAGFVCGYNYHYGKSRQGDARMLQRYCEQRAISMRIIQPVLEGGEPISSTRIRVLIESGRLEDVPTLMGQSWFYTGVVREGRHVGRSIGYRTVNLVPDGKLLPPYGVYAGRTITRNGSCDSIINIGVRPTVEQQGLPLIEAHMLNTCEECYGQSVKIEIFRFIRPEMQFDSLSALSLQIGKDIALVADICKKI